MQPQHGVVLTGRTPDEEIAVNIGDIVPADVAGDHAARVEVAPVGLYSGPKAVVRPDDLRHAGHLRGEVKPSAARKQRDDLVLRAAAHVPPSFSAGRICSASDGR